MAETTVPVEWVASSKKDFLRFPEEVRSEMGFGLYVAQRGGKHDSAKVLKGFGDAGVVELIEDRQGDTYRCVYTVRFASAVYVLHAFQKKSKSGVATPKADLDLIRRRLTTAQDDHHTKRKGQGS